MVEIGVLAVAVVVVVVVMAVVLAEGVVQCICWIRNASLQCWVPFIS